MRQPTSGFHHVHASRTFGIIIRGRTDADKGPPVATRLTMSSKIKRFVLAGPSQVIGALVFLSVAALPANAQFKTVGPAPYSPAVAHQRIRALLAKIAPPNQQQTIATLSGLLVWFREVADDELIAAWKKDEGRRNLPEAITALADGRVASAIIEFSWRERRPATFQLDFAPMLGNLMLRFPDSAKLFLDDLLASTQGADGQPALNLSEAEQYAVCRILLDMPNIGTWDKTALQVLPHYREPAETLLLVDMKEGDRDKRARALYWTSALNSITAGPSGQESQRRSLTSSGPAGRATEGVSGTLECSGDPIPKSGEYVFYNVPTANRRFEYDSNIWDVRLEQGQGNTRNLVLKNKTSKTQKRCIVRWTTVP
jgi:hypothetical protein